MECTIIVYISNGKISTCELILEDSSRLNNFFGTNFNAHEKDSIKIFEELNVNESKYKFSKRQKTCDICAVRNRETTGGWGLSKGAIDEYILL